MVLVLPRQELGIRRARVADRAPRLVDIALSHQTKRQYVIRPLRDCVTVLQGPTNQVLANEPMQQRTVKICRSQVFPRLRDYATYHRRDVCPPMEDVPAHRVDMRHPPKPCLLTRHDCGDIKGLDHHSRAILRHRSARSSTPTSLTRRLLSTPRRLAPHPHRLPPDHFLTRRVRPPKTRGQKTRATPVYMCLSAPRTHSRTRRRRIPAEAANRGQGALDRKDTPWYRVSCLPQPHLHTCIHAPF